MTAPKIRQYFEADEPTCVNCNAAESDHCDNCETCVPGYKQILFESMWICDACYLEENKGAD